MTCLVTGTGTRLSQCVRGRYSIYITILIVPLAGTLLSQIKLALPNRETHVCVFEALTQSLPKSHIAHWLQMVTVWEVNLRNANMPNPYVAHHSRMYLFC